MVGKVMRRVSERMKPTMMLSKLTLPRIQVHIWRRPRLARKIRGLLANPVSLVAAGAGFGKTAAMATYVADQHIPACWYRIDQEDTDLPVFIAYLVEAVRVRFPEFGASLKQHIEEQRGQVPAEAFVRECAALFCNDAAKLGDDLLLVVDQYHHALTVSAVDSWMQQVLLHLPANARIVVISRVAPNWSWFAASRLRGEAGEITEADLRFTKEDMREWLQGDYSYEIAEEDLALLEQWTAGWIVGLRYLAEHVMEGQTIPELLGEHSVVRKELLCYWDSEVVLPLSEDMRSFLLDGAVCDVLTKQKWMHLFRQTESFDRLFEEAKRRRLLFADTREQEWTYHPLLRQVLMQKLMAQPEHFQQLSMRIARFEAQAGRTLDALEHLRRVEAWEEIGELLADCGNEMLQTGQLDPLYNWILALPVESKERFPLLWYYQGEIERSRCVYPQALSSYGRYIERCEEAHDNIGICRGLEGQARVHLDSVQGLKAELLLKRAVSMLNPGDDDILAARLYSLLAEVYTNRGNTGLASHWIERTRELEQKAELEGEARLLFRTGRMQAAIQLLEKAWQPDKQEGTVALTRSYRETSLVLAFVYAMTGEREKGIIVSEKAIELGKAANSPFVEAYGYIRKAHSALLHKEKSVEEIRALYQGGLAILEEINSNRGKAETLMGLTLLYATEKSLDAALACAERGLQETAVIQDDWVDALIRLGMGIAYANCDEYALAEPVFLQCVERFSQCGDIFNLAICRLWLSYLAYKREDWNSFVPTVSAALTAIQAGEYQFLLQRPTMFTPTGVQKLLPILIEAQKRQVQPNYVSQLLTELGLQNVAFHPGYTLRITTLGSFRIWLDQRELGERAWQRGKAKLLFQLLLTRRHNLLAREEIIDLLWAEQDEEAAQRDFKVALNALNKALEPNREARATAFFIQRHGSSYGFNLASGYQLDAEEFERLVVSGLAEADHKQATALLEKGLAYYQGEYLPDCRYEDWCIEERERLGVLYLRGAEKLAQAYLALEQYEASIRWCEKILQIDDCWEEAYRLLMICYHRQNNRSLSLKWYEKCVAKLKEQMGVSPLPSTRDTLQLIMDQD